MEGSPKIKGGVLVRGISPAGAFNVNNNAPVIAKAVKECLANGIPVEQTIRECDNILDFQLISKASHKYSRAWQRMMDGTEVETQKVNRVYASKDWSLGTLYKQHGESGVVSKVAGLPDFCIIDNDNHLTIDAVDKEWYIRLARKYVADFLGESTVSKATDTRRQNKFKKEILKILEE